MKRPRVPRRQLPAVGSRAPGVHGVGGALHGFLSSPASNQRSAQAAQPRAVHPPPLGHVSPGPKPHQHTIVFQSPASCWREQGPFQNLQSPPEGTLSAPTSRTGRLTLRLIPASSGPPSHF